MKLNYIKIFILLLPGLSLSSGLSFGDDSLKPADSLRLAITVPKSGDTLNYDRIRFSGYAFPDAEVWLQDEKLKIYPTGAFAGMVDLSDGLNQLVFKASNGHGTVADTIFIYREPKPVTYPEIPTSVDANRISPEQDVWIFPGEKIEVSFWGSQKGEAFFSIPGVVEDEKMQEMPARKASGMRGFYFAELVIPDLKETNPVNVEFRFRGMDNQSFRFKSMGKIKVLDRRMPLIGTTTDSTSLLRISPNGEARMELPPGIKLQVLSRSNNHYRVRLSSGNIYFVNERHIGNLNTTREYPYTVVGNAQFSENTEWTELRFNATEKAPFQIVQMADEAVLEIYFYRAIAERGLALTPPEIGLIKKIKTRQQNSDVLIVRIELSQAQQWGFFGGYTDGQFSLKIRKPPVMESADSLFANVVVCVDPGHGAKLEGGISPTGLREEYLNLEVAKKVEEYLQLIGVKTVMTRTFDTTLSLPERVNIARKNGATIFLSVHFNSIPINADPESHRGASTYFTIPQSRKLAEAIYDKLVNIGLKPYQTRQTNFVVTRQTDFISVLVEGAFLTHPEDEMLLLRPEVRNAIAYEIVEGIKVFLHDAAPEEMKRAFNLEQQPYSGGN